MDVFPLLAQVYQELSSVSVRGHDDCIRMAKALEVLDSILVKATQLTTQDDLPVKGEE